MSAKTEKFEDIIDYYSDRTIDNTTLKRMFLERLNLAAKEFQKKREKKPVSSLVSGSREARRMMGMIDKNPSLLFDKEFVSKLNKSIRESDLMKKKVIDSAFDLSKKQGYLPTLTELQKHLDIARSSLRMFYNTKEELYAAMQEEDEELYKTFYSPDDLRVDKLTETEISLSRYKRFFVTSVESTTIPSHKGKILETLSKWAEKRNAAVVLMPIGHDVYRIHRDFKKYSCFHLLFGEYSFNTNLLAIPFQSTKTLHNPQQSLNKIASRLKSSVIVPSAKLTKRSIPTDISKLAHFTWTTGALTEPNYRLYERILPSKHQHYAGQEHEISGLIVEVKDDKIFFVKECMFDVDGSMVEYRRSGSFRHFPSGDVKRENIANITVPDSHVEEADKTVEKTFMNIAKINNANSVALHDVLSYRGYGHHTSDIFSKALINESGWDVKEDFKKLHNFLCEWSKCAKNIRIIGSNHDEHPKKAVMGFHLFTPDKLRLFFQWGLAALDKKNLLQYTMENMFGWKLPSNVVFLKDRQRLILKNKFGELALHYHGDFGANGTKTGSGWSKNSIAMTVGAADHGHTHEAGIISGGSFGGMGNGGVFASGTTDDLMNPPSYTRGPSSWMNTGTVTYCQANGRFLRTQISVIKGEYCLD